MPMTMVLPARAGDESMLSSGWVSSAAAQTTSPVSRRIAVSLPLLSAAYTRSPATSAEGLRAEPSCRLQISVPSLVRRAWNTPLQSPKYATPSTTTGVPVTAESPSTCQRGASRATLSGEMCVSAGFVRLFCSSWFGTGHSSCTEHVGTAPPAQAAATPSAHWTMNAWIAAWSSLDGHWPAPVASTRPHLAANFASHVPKSGMPSEVLAALALARRRQEEYHPAVRSFWNSHSAEAARTARDPRWAPAGLPPQVGNGLPASPVARPSAHCWRKAWISWSSPVGHLPMPFPSARRHRLESLASQLPESAESPSRFSVLALASSRQREYFAADFSLLNSHLPGGAAHADASSSSAPARAAVTPALAVFLMVVGRVRWGGLTEDDLTVRSTATPRLSLASCRAVPARARPPRTDAVRRRSPPARRQPNGSRPPPEPTCESARDTADAELRLRLSPRRRRTRPPRRGADRTRR